MKSTKIYPNQKILTEGYFFTTEQLNEYTKNIIKQTLETAADKAQSYAVEGEGGYMEGNIESFVVKKSITNTFEEIFNKFKV